MRVVRHVFGSVRGYGTLARGPGLSDADCRKLGSLSFGTPYDADYPQSLAEHAAFWSRPLDETRRALTRVLPGKPDDAGRPTLLFVSCVVDAEEWNFELQADALTLLRLRELWEWNGEPHLPALEIPEPKPGSWRFPDDSVQRILGLISLIEMSWRAKQPAIVRADQYSAREVAAVERLLPPSIRERYSAVYRGLNPDLPATLNCLAAGTLLGSTGAPRFLAGAQSAYARELELENFGDGHEPNLLLIGYDRFGEPKTSTGHKPAEGPTVNLPADSARGRPRRGAVPISILSFALCLLLVFLIGGVAGWLLGSPSANQPRAVDSVWADCLQLTLELPAQTREQQLHSLVELENKIDSSNLQSSEFRASLINQLHAASTTVSIIQKTEEAIAQVESGNTTAIGVAETNLSTLDNSKIGDTTLLRDWLAARQRPKEDRFPLVIMRLKDSIGPEMMRFEELANTAVRIDPLVLKQAESLRCALDQLERATSDQGEDWIAKDLNRLDGWLSKWHATLKDLDKSAQTSLATEQAELIAHKTTIADRCAALKAKITEGSDPLHRQAAAEVLRALAQDGQNLWGNIFTDTFSALADWIYNLPDPIPLEDLSNLQQYVETCDSLTNKIVSSSDELNKAKNFREVDVIGKKISKDSQSLSVKIADLKKLVAQLEKP